MFERFTERARQVVVLAQEEARNLGHQTIGTEHILLGLLREEESLAARVLEIFDYDVKNVRESILAFRAPDQDEDHEDKEDWQIPFSPLGKKVFELALREALSIGNNYIGTEHILLGLICENEGVAATVIRDHGENSEEIRNEIMRALSGPASRRAPGSRRATQEIEPKWYVYFAHGEDSVTKEGGFLNKPRMEELKSDMLRFFCSVSSEDVVEIYISTINLKHLKLVKE